MKTAFLIVLMAVAIDSVCAQTSLPVPLNIKAVYERNTRSHSGQPGKNYWQNGAAYVIDVAFDPATRLLKGVETITYYNNSPDTLKELVFKLYPNIYKKGSPRLMKIEPDDAGEGMMLDSLRIHAATGLPAYTPAHRVDGTNMMVSIKPLKPHDSLVIFIGFSYTLNKRSHIRTGEVEPGAYFIAYFFPRIAVYDDVDGWNRYPYLGTQEFYNDFCDFRVSYTVPADYQVWSTGDLLNPGELYQPKYLERIRLAENQDAVRDIVDSTEAKAKQILVPGPHTWRFSASHVSDIAFAASDHYVWQSSSVLVDSITGRRTRVDAVFNPKHKDYYYVAEDARKTVKAMSFNFPRWPFPYSHETVFDGLDQMEYPMMVNDNPVEDRHESIELTDHEIFHTMFPFYMGINETKYGWMDEGWATIGEWIISPLIDTSIVDEYGIQPYNNNGGKETDLPVMTLTTQLTGTPFFLNSYPKPALGYLFAMDITGDDRFYKGLHTYFRNWNGRHPLPWDFFNSMNSGSGVNLNWFWKRWFFDNSYPDLGILSVRGKSKIKEVVILNIGGKPVPVDLTIHFSDGTTEKLHRSAAAWEKGSKLKISFTTIKQVRQVVLGSTYVPDVNKKDNTWIIK